jgi:hypothetical protein
MDNLNWLADKTGVKRELLNEFFINVIYASFL